MAYVVVVSAGLLAVVTWAQGPGGFGPPPGFGPPGFGPGSVERKLLKQFDANSDGWLNQQERAAAREFVKKNPNAGRGGQGGPGGFGPPGGGRGFGPGMMFVAPVSAVVDANQDKKVSRDEFLKGSTQFIEFASKGQPDKTLSEKQVVETINRLLPPPPGMNVPAGFSLGEMIGPGIAKRVDQDSDGKLTEAEFNAALGVLFKSNDRNENGELDEEELSAAIMSVFPQPGGPGGPGGGGPGRGPGGPFGPGGRSEPGKPGPKVALADVKQFDAESLYDNDVLRTFFFEFENSDWEEELQDFHGTDIDVPATLIVDGKRLENVGLRFRGMSSYGMVPAGSKRSFNVSLDLANSKQKLGGYKTLNLLNAHEDPSFMSTVLYSRIARRHIAAPLANFVKVVINGESWGVYVNTQQFNKDFLAENYPSSKGTRWKVSGNPGASGGLEFFGEDIEEYKRRFEMKSNDGDKEWKTLIKLCRVLNETKPEDLEAALRPMLDIEEALWFLALDVALINNDGYWVRASDYSIYLDPKGVFHILPHDMNEALHGQMGFGPPGMGPGGPGGRGPGGFLGGLFGGPPRDGDRPMPPQAERPGEPRPGEGRPNERRNDRPEGNGARGGAAELDPLVATDDPRKPLRSKLLNVPKFREQYLRNVRTIAEQDLNWEWLGPVVADLRELVDAEIKADTRKLSSYDAFVTATANEAPAKTDGPGSRQLSLRAFADQRRAFLQNHPEIKKLAR